MRICSFKAPFWIMQVHSEILGQFCSNVFVTAFFFHFFFKVLHFCLKMFSGSLVAASEGSILHSGLWPWESVGVAEFFVPLLSFFFITVFEAISLCSSSSSAIYECLGLGLGRSMVRRMRCCPPAIPALGRNKTGFWFKLNFMVMFSYIVMLKLTWDI